jgi:biotin carboxyl carrier protein
VEGETFEVWPDQDMAVLGSQLTGPTQIKPLEPVSLQHSDNRTIHVDASKPTLTNLEDLDNLRFKSIRAPIPGLITQIFVVAGSTVEIGQELLKLEAMKMNNSICANHSGVVRAVHVSVGQAVKLNQVLLEFA